MEIQRLQRAIREAGFDGWLFCDFHNRDPLAYRILGMDGGKFTSRRWFYWVPAQGEPVRLVSRVEPSRLDEIPGQKRFYLSFQELQGALAGLLQGRRVAMQWSPDHAIPYVSTVDGGMVDLVRSAGAEVVSSADLVQVFEAVLDEEGYRSHLSAGERVHRVKDEAFQRIRESRASGDPVTEYEVQCFIVQRFEDLGLTCEGERPIVGVNDHPADPHFEPTPENARPIRPGDTVLIDLWARDRAPGSIWHDITWCGVVGDRPPEEYVRIFDVVRRARDACIAFIRDRLGQGQECRGYEADEACRAVVREAGYGDFFIHRTGHSIGTAVHGNGANLDGLETRDLRRLVPGICFSVEPGIYLPGRMAVRTEVDVFIRPDGQVEVTGPAQQELLLL